MGLPLGLAEADAVTTVIGLDLSLSATGLATWVNGSWMVTTIHAHRQDVPPASGWDRPVRWSQILQRVEPYTRDPSGVLAVVEEKIRPSEEAARGTSTLDLAELRGAVYLALYVRRVRIVEIHPSTLKSFGALNGKASKADMVESARRWLGTSVYVQDDNAADAAWLVGMALAKYGWDQPGITGTPLKARKRFDALGRTAALWPHFRLEMFNPMWEDDDPRPVRPDWKRP